MDTKDPNKIYPSRSVVVDEGNNNRDLGFGSVVARESRQRLLNQDGSFNVHRRGLRNVALRNLYHWLLTMSWWQFLGFVVLLYLGINFVFGLMFWNERSGFNRCAQTIRG